jgi:hypothetical protein
MARHAACSEEAAGHRLRNLSNQSDHLDRRVEMIESSAMGESRYGFMI